VEVGANASILALAQVIARAAWDEYVSGFGPRLLRFVDTRAGCRSPGYDNDLGRPVDDFSRAHHAERLKRIVRFDDRHVLVFGIEQAEGDALGMLAATEIGATDRSLGGICRRHQECPFEFQARGAKTGAWIVVC
jgi:hypothetical protein